MYWRKTTSSSFTITSGPVQVTAGWPASTCFGCVTERLSNIGTHDSQSPKIQPTRIRCSKTIPSFLTAGVYCVPAFYISSPSQAAGAWTARSLLSNERSRGFYLIVRTWASSRPPTYLPLKGSYGSRHIDDLSPERNRFKSQPSVQFELDPSLDQHVHHDRIAAQGVA